MMPLITGLQLTLCADSMDKAEVDHLHFEIPVWGEYRVEASVWIALGKWYPETDRWEVNVENTHKMNEAHQVQLAMAVFKQTLEDLGVDGEVIAFDSSDPNAMEGIAERIKNTPKTGVLTRAYSF